MQRRRLDVEIVRRGLASSRQAAQEAIDARRVTVSGAIAEKAARMVAPDEPVEMLGPPRRFVGRGGEKLEFALAHWDIDVAGARCLDVGASTGGFTDCLLQRGAGHVYAVDVGHGQLDSRLRDDDRVTVYEKLDARDLRLPHVGGAPVAVAVADVSFISLRLVTPAVMGVTHHDAVVVYLVKPQFEASRAQVGKGGVVRDPEVWAKVLSRLSGQFSAQNLYMVDVVASPIRGAEGNVEFLALLRKNQPSGRMRNEQFEAIAAAAADTPDTPAGPQR